MTTPDRDDPDDPKLAPAPMARVRRMELIRREVREYLAEGALEVLFDRAEVVVEGDEELLGAAGGTHRRVYATIMVTIDLRRCEEYFREPADAETAARIVELLQRAAHPPAPLLAIARAELARIAGTAQEHIRVSVEQEVRADGPRILIDGDAMAVIEPRLRNRR